MTLAPGLEGIVAAETHLSHVDGLLGELIIGGFPLEALASQATFEETVYLLWHDHLPNAEELADFKAKLTRRRELPQITLDLLKAAAQQSNPVMDALRIGASTLSLVPHADDDAEGPVHDALLAVAACPTIVAAYWRLLNGQQPIQPRADLNHAANYLYMLTGQVPSEAHIRGMETYLNTVVDHSLNASTFTTRVIISTNSDMISAVVGGIGALKGPAHGGAPGPALDMVFEIGTAANAEPYLRRKLESGERLMGFGHRAYKVRDPRADVLGEAADKFYRAGGDMALYDLALKVEDVALRLLEEYKPGRKLQTNVEYYTALLLNGLGLSTELFTPTFAVSRVGGWTAHAFEQLRNNRIFRPSSQYVGELNRQWVPVEDR